MAQNARKMANEELNYAISALRRRKGLWPQIERETGLDYSWLSKLSRGQIGDPGIKRVGRLAAYLRLLDEQEDQRVAAMDNAQRGGGEWLSP